MVNKIKGIVISLLKNPLFYILIALFVIDITSKWIIVNKIPFGDHIVSSEYPIIPNFILVTRSHNTGSAFGFGSGSIGYRIFLIILRLALTIAIPVVYLLKGRGLKKRYKVVLALIYAGCIGNFIDITFYWKSNCGFDGVVDWIRFSFWDKIFNLADAYVVIGVVLLIVFLLIDEIIEIKEKRKTGIYDLPPEEYEAKMREENIKKNGFSNDNKTVNK